MKVLVTGDREWDDVDFVADTLSQFPSGTILIEGECRGADLVCRAVAEALDFEVRKYPADWARYGRAAGPIRNQQMLDTEHVPNEPIDIAFVFHVDLTHSRGTADMVRRITKSKIKYEVICHRR